MAASTFYPREVYRFGGGTTAHWVRFLKTTDPEVAQRWAAVEVQVESTGVEAWIRRDGTVATTGTTGEGVWHRPASDTGGNPSFHSELVPYSTQISILLSSTSIVYVRGLPGWMI